MHALKILDDFYFIERGYLNANHFAYLGPKPALIDTGYLGSSDQTLKALKSLSLDPAKVGLIVNTHCHCDHIGANRIIQDLSGCDIAVHEIGAHFIETRDTWSTWWDYYGFEADFFTCTDALSHGREIALGPHRFEVIYTPGHSADSIVLYNREHKILISADALWEHDLPPTTVRIEGNRTLFTILESLEKIQALDVKTVYPGHGPPFTNIKQSLDKTREIVGRYLQSRDRLGLALIKKIILYTIMSQGSVPKNRFFARLMLTPWFRENVDLYFSGEYRPVYDQVMTSLIRRGIVFCQDGSLHTIVKP